MQVLLGDFDELEKWLTDQVGWYASHEEDDQIYFQDADGYDRGTTSPLECWDAVVSVAIKWCIGFELLPGGAIKHVRDDVTWYNGDQASAMRAIVRAAKEKSDARTDD